MLVSHMGLTQNTSNDWHRMGLAQNHQIGMGLAQNRSNDGPCPESSNWPSRDVSCLQQVNMALR